MIRDIFLLINVLLTVPFYSISVCFWMYVLLVYLSPSLWLRSIVLLYIPYCIVDKTPTRGQRLLSQSLVEWLRGFPCFRGVAAYFPVNLHKTTDLDPSHAYIFLYHPHGVIGMGANTALNTNGCSFQKVFPGIRRWGVTLNASFLAPLFREWMLMLNFISANKETLVAKLQQKDSVVLVPG